MYVDVRSNRLVLIVCAWFFALACDHKTSGLGPQDSDAARDVPSDTSLPDQTRDAARADGSTNDSGNACANGLIPAFPGAEGGGAASVGGRGGRVLEVTTLADSGAGSLRAALDAPGPRIVVFRTSGTIRLQRPLSIDRPFVTVAGQTAPGGGVMLSGEDIDLQPLSIGTHDVILRYLKIRTGRGDSYRPGAGDVIAMGEGGDLFNVIIDHCSLSWGNDENVALWSDSGVIRDVTISNNIISEGLHHDRHSTGLIVGSNLICEDIQRISVHHNFFAHNYNRNPYLKVASQEVINNIVYNWGWLATQIAGGVEIDIVGNLYKAGVDDQGRSEVAWRSDRRSCNEGPPGPPSIHLAGNVGPHNDDPSVDGWDTMLERTEAWANPPPFTRPTRVTRDYQRSNRMSFAACPVTIDPVQELEDTLLPNVGASRRLDARGEWVSNRDEVDQRVLREYRDGGGAIILTESDVGGFPDVASGEPYTDTDRDGMADEWERIHGFNPSSASDGPTDRDGDGYTNAEEFLNGTQP